VMVEYLQSMSNSKNSERCGNILSKLKVVYNKQVVLHKQGVSARTLG
jgi:hypothetical protein